MKITKLKNKYKIELENRPPLVTYDDIILKYNILFKKNLDENLISKIEEENIFYDAYYSSIKYIEHKLRSEYEMQKYLDKFLINNKEKNQIIEKLKNLNLINDSLLAQAFVNDRIKFTNFGPYKIKQELEKLKVDENLIDNALNKIENNVYYEKIKKIANKKFKTNQKYSGNVLKQKIFIELNNLGYPKNIIDEYLSSIVIKGNVNEIYNKIYQKLSKKYSGYELDKKIEQKLYTMGFSKIEIDEKNNS